MSTTVDGALAALSADGPGLAAAGDLPGTLALGDRQGRRRTREMLAQSAAPVLENGFVSRAIPSQRGPSRLSPRHEQMITWLIGNPDRSLGDMAKELGWSRDYVSIIVNSDAFQAKYQELCAELNVECVHTMKAKLTAVTASALDRMHERLEGRGGQPSEKFIVDSTRTLLGAIGFGGPRAEPASSHVHQHLHVEAGDLIRARELAAGHFAGRGRGVVAEAAASPSA